MGLSGAVVVNDQPCCLALDANPTRRCPAILSANACLKALVTTSLTISPSGIA